MGLDPPSVLGVLGSPDWDPPDPSPPVTPATLNFQEVQQFPVVLAHLVYLDLHSARFLRLVLVVRLFL